MNVLKKVLSVREGNILDAAFWLNIYWNRIFWLYIVGFIIKLDSGQISYLTEWRRGGLHWCIICWIPQLQWFNEVGFNEVGDDRVVRGQTFQIRGQPADDQHVVAVDAKWNTIIIVKQNQYNYIDSIPPTSKIPDVHTHPIPHNDIIIWTVYWYCLTATFDNRIVKVNISVIKVLCRVSNIIHVA